MRHAPPDLDTLQKAIDGYIELIFSVQSPYQHHHHIIGYVNDEGLLRRLPVHYSVDYGNSHVLPIYGRVVILAVTNRGESAVLTSDEIGLVIGSIKNGVIYLSHLSLEGIRES